MPSPIAKAIIDDLQPRDTEWFVHDILTQTVPKVLSAAPYLTDMENDIIRGAANQFGSDVFVLVDLALTAHIKHTRVCRRHMHP